MLVKLAMALLPTSTVGLGIPSPAGGGPGAAWALGLAVAVGFFVIAVYVLRFFTSMAYLRSVATRFPDIALYKRATTFMWLGPVLAVCSIVTCFISLAVAYVFYLVNLDKTRRLLRETLDAMRSVSGDATTPVSSAPH